MKVYFHLLILAFFSIVLVGCTADKDKIGYKIENSGGTNTITGSISLNDSGDIAYISSLSGSVTIDAVAVIQGTIIRENSLLVTGSGAEAEIIFSDSSVVRLSPDSRLQISKKGTDNTTLDLREGSVWARVLKPFTDSSFFTLESDDLSAGVRGTSVWMVTNSGGTDIGIVDTTATGGQSSGALVDIVNKAYFGSGNIHLSDEDILRVRHSRPIEHKKMKLREQMKLYPYIGINTIRDIRYMNKIIQDPTSQMGTRGRVSMEMKVTMPNPEEIMMFVSDSLIVSEIKKQIRSELTPTEFIKYLDLNDKIQAIIESKIPEADKKKAIEDMRKLVTDTIEQKSSTGSSVSTGTIAPVSQPKKINTVPTRITTSTVSGESKPCRSTTSGEPCR